MKTTQVLSVSAAGSCRVESRPLPTPGRGELRIRLEWCGLCGTDLHKLARRKASPGSVLGHEIVGEVDEVGDGVGIPQGSRVVLPHHVACGECRLCHGGFETQCPAFRELQIDPGGFSASIVARARIVERSVWSVPEDVSSEAAVFLEPLACVVRSLKSASQESEPQDVAVLGGGSMGLLHLLALRALRPRDSVTVLEPLEARRNVAKELGATTGEAPGAAERFDVVFDTAGGAGALSDAQRLVRAGGTVVLFAHASQPEIPVRINDMFRREIRLVGSYSSSASDLVDAAQLLTRHLVDPTPLITHRLSFSRFAEAVAACEGQRALKVLLRPD